MTEMVDVFKKGHEGPVFYSVSLSISSKASLVLLPDSGTTISELLDDLANARGNIT